MHYQQAVSLNFIIVIYMKRAIIYLLLVDPAFDAIPNQQKQGLMKTLLNYVGIKGQDNTSNLDSYTAAPIDSTYVPTPSSYTQPSSGLASGIHYMPPRDLQNRKAA